MSNSGDNPIIGDDGENAIFNAGVQTTPPREEDGRGIPPPVMVNQPPPVQPGASSGGWPLLGPRLHPDRADSRQPPPQVYPGALNGTNNPIYIPSLRRQPQPSYGYQFDRGLPHVDNYLPTPS
ncbi:hypothetical protein FOZ60_006584 [Perkinsus olseni]|uniref:Uncharacterized protein n=1 Tax=Perkinsus olseni TaxID=32597 RepID=A0A7J6NNI5_PEROL|nr:hypothetical protein FOZ60_006584 [Perkinsus olseni]